MTAKKICGRLFPVCVCVCVSGSSVGGNHDLIQTDVFPPLRCHEMTFITRQERH